MRKVKYRFFHNSVTGQYFMETIHFYLWMDGPVGNDSRCAPIGESVLHPATGEMTDLWLPVLTLNPAFDASVLIPTYNTETAIGFDEDGQAIEVQRPVSVLTQPGPISPHDLPLLPDLTEITMAQYNAGIST